MKHETALQRAQLVVQAIRADVCPPPVTDPEVIAIAKLPFMELQQKYQWARQAMSAMRWNTATLNLGHMDVASRRTR